MIRTDVFMIMTVKEDEFKQIKSFLFVGRWRGEREKFSVFK